MVWLLIVFVLPYCTELLNFHTRVQRSTNARSQAPHIFVYLDCDNL
jgi:hypothetical protein